MLLVTLVDILQVDVHLIKIYLLENVQVGWIEWLLGAGSLLVCFNVLLNRTSIRGSLITGWGSSRAALLEELEGLGDW